MEELLYSIQDIVNTRALYNNTSSVYSILKRISDIFISLTAMILFLPLLIIIAVIIKIDSRGPVIFAQERNGFKGRIFRMYKFRSMVTIAEDMLKDLQHENEAGSCMFKIKCDPRITRIGRIIRKTSMDELPQLVNVLKGEMSIVGPRPPIMREVFMYDAWHKLRLSVKPGMTGLWQISGRSKVGFEEMVRLDLKYIRERSLIYDLKIILRTIPVLFGDEKAL